MGDEDPCGREPVRRNAVRTRMSHAAIAALVGVWAAGFGHAAAATDLVGTWRGDGTAITANGKSYTIRCLISFRESDGGALGFDGRCSTIAETAAGSGHVTGRGGERYSGTVTGLSTGVSGRIEVAPAVEGITIAVTGNEGRLDVTMRRATVPAE